MQRRFTGPCGVAITQQPESLQVCEGDPAVFHVEAQGENLSYQWQHDDQNIPGATTDTLMIDAATSEDEGDYRCIVADHCDNSETSVEASLALAPPAVINTQPMGGTFCVGDSIFLFAGVSGGVSLQWFKDGEAIPGAVSAFLSITNAQTTDSGDYQLFVSGACNDVQSDIATIVVESCGDGG
jgi:hypothetical protein